MADDPNTVFQIAQLQIRGLMREVNAIMGTVYEEDGPEPVNVAGVAEEILAEIIAIFNEMVVDTRDQVLSENTRRAWRDLSDDLDMLEASGNNLFNLSLGFAPTTTQDG